MAAVLGFTKPPVGGLAGGWRRKGMHFAADGDEGELPPRSGEDWVSHFCSLGMRK